MSVRFWRSAGRFAASYKALFMHVTCDMYRAIPIYRWSDTSKMKRDIRMANYEKQEKQEGAHPIPLTLPPMPHCLVYSARREDDTCFIFSHFGLFLSDAASNSHK